MRAKRASVASSVARRFPVKYFHIKSRITHKYIFSQLLTSRSAAFSKLKLENSRGKIKFIDSYNVENSTTMWKMPHLFTKTPCFEKNTQKNKKKNNINPKQVTSYFLLMHFLVMHNIVLLYILVMFSIFTHICFRTMICIWYSILWFSIIWCVFLVTHNIVLHLFAIHIWCSTFWYWCICFLFFFLFFFLLIFLFIYMYAYQL